MSDRALVDAMVEFEVALLRALAAWSSLRPRRPTSLRPLSSEGALDLDVAELGRATGEQGTPVPGLLRALRRQLLDERRRAPAQGRDEPGRSRHRDDARHPACARRRARGPVGGRRRLRGARVERHRGAIEPGRTLLQQALPLTFGLKAAGWLDGLDGAARGAAPRSARASSRCSSAERSARWRASAIAGSTSPPSSADQLSLPAPALPWHTIRLRPVRIACRARSRARGDWARSDATWCCSRRPRSPRSVEGGGPGRGGSSTMPHKRNPVGAIGLVACAQRAPGLVATMLGAMMQEHERGAGKLAGRVGDAAGAAAADRVGGGARCGSCSPGSRSTLRRCAATWT